MGGVLDEHGQWERCNECARWVLIQELLYEQPSEEYEFGRDLCDRCYQAPRTIREFTAKITYKKRGCFTAQLVIDEEVANAVNEAQISIREFKRYYEQYGSAKEDSRIDAMRKLSVQLCFVGLRHDIVADQAFRDSEKVHTQRLAKVQRRTRSSQPKFVQQEMGAMA